MIVKQVLSVFLTFFLLSAALPAIAQDNHFIYIQSGNGEPFYIRLEGKLYSSTSAGYIILSKLKSGDYEVRIGFPKDAYPEEIFVISVNGENEGYLLKNVAGQWNLENIQTKKVTAAISAQQPQQPDVQTGEPAKTNDVFSTMLAEVIRDSSILRTKRPEVAAPANPSKKPEAIADIPPVKTFSASVDSTKQILAPDTTLATAVTTEIKPEPDSSGKVEVASGEPFVKTLSPAVDSTKKILQPADSIRTNSVANTKVAPDSTRPVGVARGEAVKNLIPSVDSTKMTLTTEDSVLTKANEDKKNETAITSLPNSDTSKVAFRPEAKELTVMSQDKQESKTETPIARLLMVNANGGQEMLYLDKQSNDTIRLFMPVDTTTHQPRRNVSAIIDSTFKRADSALTVTPAVITPAPATDPIEPVEAKTPVNNDSSSMSARIIYQDKPVTTKNKSDDDQQSAINENAVINPDCTNLATEKDFLRLRKRIAGEHDSFKMIEAAQRFFKLKCYTTEQIRNLSFLFLDDEGKYQFFDAAFPHTSDVDRFYTLEPLLKDPYYVNRFKAMIHK